MTVISGSLVLMILSAWFMQSYSGKLEATPIARPLKTFPLHVGDWIGSELPMNEEAIRLVGVTDHLSRMYQKTGAPPMGLYVGYYAKNIPGVGMHSPKHCLPGGGRDVIRKEEIELPRPGQKPFPSNLLTLGKHGETMMAMFWYHSQGRLYANEYLGVVYRFCDAVTKRRTDGTLVRILCTIPEGYSERAAYLAMRDFAQAITPILTGFLPGRDPGIL